MKEESSGSQPEPIERKDEWEQLVLQPFVSRRPARERHANYADFSDPEDLYWEQGEGGNEASRLGFPGSPPFTRGVTPNMYRGRLWTMRQYAGFGGAEASNRRYRALLAAGQTGLSVAFDLPTQMGRDSDHPMAQGEVGRVGVAIDSLADMEMLFDNIPLGGVSTSMTINATAPILLALYAAAASRKGVALKELRGTVQNDILKEYVARGTYIYPPAPSLRLIRDIFAFCRDHMPKWNTISVSGYHMREAGADAAQELAFTVGNGIAYVETGVQAGLDVDRFGQQLSFFFNAHSNFVEEIAKFRAARRLWCTIMTERFGARSDKARALRFHAQTAGSSLQAQQPLVNAIRTTIQALAAVAGGCQSLHTNGYDEALSLPTREAAILALRTQQVIGYESGLPDIVDAFGGSYAVEAMTDRLEKRALEYLSTIDSLGGMVAAIEQGYVQRQIQNTAYEQQLRIEDERQVLVGVNRFTEESSEPIETMSVDPESEEQQRQRLAEVKSQRDSLAVEQALEEVKRAASTDRNVMEPILGAVRALATVGEISDVFRDLFGEHQEHVTV